MSLYNFDCQLQKGEDGERFLDRFFSDRYAIEPATREQQRKGIDRIFKHRGSDQVLRVEYKTDFLAHKTGNAFIETVSVDSEDKKGWIYTSQADYLMYFVVGDLLIYVVRFPDLRRAFAGWVKKYPSVKARNESYYTHGILVPLLEFEKVSEVPPISA